MGCRSSPAGYEPRWRYMIPLVPLSAGVKLGRKPKLTEHQRERSDQAARSWRRLQNCRSYNVSGWTIFEVEVTIRTESSGEQWDDTRLAHSRLFGECQLSADDNI
jgi:hypothetical protein